MPGRPLKRAKIEVIERDWTVSGLVVDLEAGIVLAAGRSGGAGVCCWISELLEQRLLDAAEELNAARAMARPLGPRAMRGPRSAATIGALIRAIARQALTPLPEPALALDAEDQGATPVHLGAWPRRRPAA